MKKKKNNATSMLGLVIEIIAMAIMGIYYFQGNPIPKFCTYLFTSGLLIVVAGAVISTRNHKKY